MKSNRKKWLYYHGNAELKISIIVTNDLEESNSTEVSFESNDSIAAQYKSEGWSFKYPGTTRYILPQLVQGRDPLHRMLSTATLKGRRV
jgi:hypothetical protein